MVLVVQIGLGIVLGFVVLAWLFKPREVEPRYSTVTHFPTRQERDRDERGRLAVGFEIAWQRFVDQRVSACRDCYAATAWHFRALPNDGFHEPRLWLALDKSERCFCSAACESEFDRAVSQLRQRS